MKNNCPVSENTKEIAGKLVSKLYEDFKTIDWYLFEDSFEGKYCENGSVDLKWENKDKYLFINVAENGRFFSYYGKSPEAEIESKESIGFSKFYINNFKKVQEFLKNCA